MTVRGGRCSDVGFVGERHVLDIVARLTVGVGVRWGQVGCRNRGCGVGQDDSVDDGGVVVGVTPGLGGVSILGDGAVGEDHRLCVGGCATSPERPG